jgi:hypothetical protein
MPGKRIPKRKLAEVLRLKFAAQLSHEKVARPVGLSKGTVNKHVSLAQAPGLSWPLPEGMDEAAPGARIHREPPPGLLIQSGSEGM